jgi:hypothetical protein
MGIDFSHGSASWSYGGFHAARVKLADAVGFRLEEMVGFGGDRDWSAIDSPLVPLLNHSDCDGELSVEECKTVAPALRKIVRDAPWPESEKLRWMMLADGMDDAVVDNEPLEFM